MGLQSSTGTPSWAWITFAAAVAGMLAVDLFAYRGRGDLPRRVAFAWSMIWIAAGLLFGVFVWIAFGARLAQEYLGAYAMEKSLSLDNLFVFLIIFHTLNVPQASQHKVLFWGILGAIVFRGIFIFLGVAALRRWEWISWIFGAILFYAAFRAWRDDPAREKRSAVVEWLSQRLPVTPSSASGEFVIRKNGGRCATPLLIALLAIELADVMFAIDSVPAALSITRNEFIVYSSNIFAILGLRALYLFLAQTIRKLRYLRYGLAAVLGFAGLKIVANDWLSIPPLVSTGIIGALIGAAVWASLRANAAAVQPLPQ